MTLIRTLTAFALGMSAFGALAQTVVAELRERDPNRHVELRIADGLVAPVLDSVDGMIDLFASPLGRPPVIASGSAQHQATGQSR